MSTCRNSGTVPVLNEIFHIRHIARTLLHLTRPRLLFCYQPTGKSPPGWLKVAPVDSRRVNVSMKARSVPGRKCEPALVPTGAGNLKK
jgi:hypothetical protein